MKPIIIGSLLFIFSFFFFSCAFPLVNNQYEKAGTLKQGNIELAGSSTCYSTGGVGETIATNNNFGFLEVSLIYQNGPYGLM